MNATGPGRESSAFATYFAVNRLKKAEGVDTYDTDLRVFPFLKPGNRAIERV